MADQTFNYNPRYFSLPKNLSLAKKYFDTLSDSDINHQHYKGLPYQKVDGFFQRIWNFTQLGSKWSTLQNFYPYSKNINSTQQQFEEDKHHYIKNAVILTVASWTLLYQLAKKGRVLPILRLYGNVFQTHRLFRQYAYTLILPFATADILLLNKYHDHVELSWNIHVNRLNQQNLEDPTDSEYPEELKESFRNIYIPYLFETPFTNYN